MACIGMIAWKFVVVKDNFVGQVLTFTLLYGSLYSTYIWPGKTKIMHTNACYLFKEGISLQQMSKFSTVDDDFFRFPKV